MNRIVYKLDDLAIVIEPDRDQIAVAKEDIARGTLLENKGEVTEINDSVKKGQRFAIYDIKEGEYVRQYGYAFGQSRGILKGDLIRVSNIRNKLPEAGIGNYRKPAETEFKEKYLKKTFSGYERKDGRVGTRNYYLIIPTSMCASETALQISLSLENNEDIRQQYPDIDGIVAIPHTEGCGCDSGLQIDRLMTVLKGYACHPNVGGCLLMNLGCEQTNYERMHEYIGGTVSDGLKPIDWITIQESGGTRAAMEKARKIIINRLSLVNQAERKLVPIAKLVVGTECGASDSFSGITANPIIGNAVDKLIAGGGSAILSEVTEMLGTFEMLLPRFRDMETAFKFEKALE